MLAAHIQGRLPRHDVALKTLGNPAPDKPTGSERPLGFTQPTGTEVAPNWRSSYSSSSS
jgi:hypothetical protein